MTDLRKAADLALQALDIWEDGLTDPCANFGWRFACMGKEAQEALRQALAPTKLPRPDEPIWVVDEKGNKQLLAKQNRAPPKREWVGLTDEEIKKIVGPWGDTPIKGYTRKLFDQIEAKLKEKNT